MSNRNELSRSTAGVKLARGNYIIIPVGYGDTMLVPATAKTMEAYNLLFGPDALRVDRHWDDNGDFFELSFTDHEVKIQSSDKLQTMLRERIVKEGDGE